VELRTFARALRLEADGSGRVTGAVWVDRATGLMHFQQADVVVLAANGIGTPRLLLASDNLANESDQVGRNLLHHTLVGCQVYVDEPLMSHAGYVGSLISREFAETDATRGFVNGFNFICVTDGGPGEQALGYQGRPSAPWGKSHHGWFENHFSRGFGIFAVGDDLPHQDNRVSLSQQDVDDHGIPLAHVAYEPHENDWRMMRYMSNRLAEFAAAAQATEYSLITFVDEHGRYRPPAPHILGTCRMGESSESSVVGRWHQSWSTPNLFILDGSVLPTGGAVNPTATVSALALRAAEHLRDNFRDLRSTRRSWRGE
jgi:choline dehydrogenase-like flavoprotein